MGAKKTVYTKWWRSVPIGAFRGSASGGVPLIVFYCDGLRGSGSRIFKALRHVLPFFEREGRRRVVHAFRRRVASRPARSALAAGKRNGRKESDILDVWFDSGCTNLSVLGEKRRHMACGHVPRRPRPIPRAGFKGSLLIAVGIREARALPRSDDVRMGAG